MAISLLWTHRTWWEREGPLCGLFYKCTTLIHEVSPCMTELLPKGSTTQYHLIAGVGFQYMNLGGGHRHSAYSIYLTWFIFAPYVLYYKHG